MESKKIKTLFCMPPKWTTPGVEECFDWNINIASIDDKVKKYIGEYDLITTIE